MEALGVLAHGSCGRRLRRLDFAARSAAHSPFGQWRSLLAGHYVPRSLAEASRRSASHPSRHARLAFPVRRKSELFRALTRFARQDAREAICGAGYRTFHVETACVTATASGPSAFIAPCRLRCCLRSTFLSHNYYPKPTDISTVARNVHCR